MACNLRTAVLAANLLRTQKKRAYAELKPAQYFGVNQQLGIRKMRIISLLIGLLVVAYFINLQISSKSPSKDIIEIIDKQDISLPKIPVTPKDLKEFETDINKFLQDAMSERKKELDKIADTKDK